MKAQISWWSSTTSILCGLGLSLVFMLYAGGRPSVACPYEHAKFALDARSHSRHPPRVRPRSAVVLPPASLRSVDRRKARRLRRIRPRAGGEVARRADRGRPADAVAEPLGCGAPARPGPARPCGRLARVASENRCYPPGPPGRAAAVGARAQRPSPQRLGDQDRLKDPTMATPESKLVRTGIAGLDAILPGGIPRGNVILVEGAIGTGKTTLGVEFVYRGIKDFGEPGVIVVFEVSPDKLTRDAASLGWDLRELEREERLKIIFTTREVFRQELQQADSLLIDEANKIGARRIFIDGVAGLLPGGAGTESRETFHILVQGLQRENLTALMALEAVALRGDSTSLHEESLADTVIRLRVEDSQRAATRSIEIVKSRGHDFQMGRHSFRIVNGQGIE